MVRFIEASKIQSLGEDRHHPCVRGARVGATAHGDAIDIRDASNLKHKGTSHASQKEPPEYPGCHLYADFLPHPGLQSHTLIAADYFGVTLAAYLPDKTLNSQIDATMEL